LRKNAEGLQQIEAMTVELDAKEGEVEEVYDRAELVSRAPRSWDCSGWWASWSRLTS
jgi:hypothetical protein